MSEHKIVPKKYIAKGMATHEGKTFEVYLDWSDEGGGWYQWRSTRAWAKLFDTEKEALEIAKQGHGPWFNKPKVSSIVIEEIDTQPEITTLQSENERLRAQVESLERNIIESNDDITRLEGMFCYRDGLRILMEYKGYDGRMHFIEEVYDHETINSNSYDQMINMIAAHAVDQWIDLNSILKIKTKPNPQDAFHYSNGQNTAPISFAPKTKQSD